MSIDTTWQTGSSSSDATFAIGERFGKRCRGGEVIILESDLGGGKTTFTKGLARGMGSEETVTSPSFMVSRIYKGRSGLIIYHFDFYRLTEAGIVGQELGEALEDKAGVIVIEWANTVERKLPTETIRVHIERVLDDENARLITVTCSPKYAYLIEGE